MVELDKGVMVRPSISAFLQRSDLQVLRISSDVTYKVLKWYIVGFNLTTCNGG